MRAKEISLATPFYVVNREQIVIVYPTSVSYTFNGEIRVMLFSQYWDVDNQKFNNGYLGYEERRFYWDLEKAQQYQHQLRKEIAERVKRELDMKYKEHEDAQHLLYSPLSNPE